MKLDNEGALMLLEAMVKDSATDFEGGGEELRRWRQVRNKRQKVT